MLRKVFLMLKEIPQWQAVLKMEKVLTCKGLFKHLFLFSGSTTMNVVHARIIIAHRLTRHKNIQSLSIFIGTALGRDMSRNLSFDILNWMARMA